MKEFDKIAFLVWICDEYEIDPVSWDYHLLVNLIEYGLAHHNNSKDQLAYFLSDIIPEVEFEDIAKFCDNSILTSCHTHK